MKKSISQLVCFLVFILAVSPVWATTKCKGTAVDRCGDIQTIYGDTNANPQQLDHCERHYQLQEYHGYVHQCMVKDTVEYADSTKYSQTCRNNNAAYARCNPK